MTGHGTTKPNDARYPNRHDKNRRVELSLVLDMSKNDLAQFANLGMTIAFKLIMQGYLTGRER